MKLREYLHHQITIGSWPDGKLTGMNVLLIWVILAAVVVGVISTEPEILDRYRQEILWAEIAFGVFFLAEYLARIYAAPEMPGEGSDWVKRWRFIRSPIGLVDLAVVIVSLAPFFIANAAALRLLRLLRVFALAKLGHFSAAMREILGALRERSYDLLVCAALAFSLLLVGASGLYWLEGHLQPDNFGSIPRALWWAVITLTTVGYGDAYPITTAGKLIGSLVAVGGVLLVALPTGIFAAAFSDAMQRRREAVAKALAEIEEIG
ncbi:ion transporter [Qipengyuania sp. 1NDW9]|uniref:Ion transporter n=2 Tax=Qipengyuania TaxID=1855416 RepID=A0A9Q3S2A7_9SPHN|nr:MULTISPECIES: ion transporter [Qipengyuania]MBX7492125.1 ion transporter [Qipengyuania xiapuensis]MBY6218702.1 ion transporter [Qipengyuania aquimaris]QZD93633.1 ion transporter [Qipengyuania xiapuensis]